MTHIFIVNENTFKIHLEYMFAGTGYGDNVPDFVGTKKLSTKADSTEKTFVDMIADISKVRKGDKVAFYVTGCKKIFGFFKVATDPFFVNKKDDKLKDDLGRYLPFRVKIEPDKVFSEGITEIEALDDITEIEHPYQMCWSLIYRKLTGMRGCSFVTDYEYLSLKKKIIKKNKVNIKSKAFSYDSKSQKIVTIPDIKSCSIVAADLSIEKRLLSVSNAFERHLQAFIIQNYDRPVLKDLLLPRKYTNLWIGNEVVCSVGEQRIDILLISETKEKHIIRIIELKHGHPYKGIVTEQITWYIKWVQQYLVPNLSNKTIEIIPTIIADPYKRDCPGKRDFESACVEYNKNKPSKTGLVEMLPLEFISFKRNKDHISFKKEF